MKGILCAGLLVSLQAITAAQAYEAGLLSEGQLAERLGTDRVGARERVQAIASEAQPDEEGQWRQASLDLTTPLVGAR